MSERTMTPDHLKWSEFCDLLGGPEGCNFRYEPPESKQGAWNCGPEHALARKILREHFPAIDADASCDYFTEHGAGCDCEIIFNLEDKLVTACH